MPSLVVGTLRALFTLDSAQFEAGIRQSEQSLKAFSKNSQRLGQQASAIGGALTKGITLPLVALGAGASKAAIDFESSFTGVRKTVDATEAQFADLAQGLRDLSQEIPINVNELNRIGEAAGQLGVKQGDILAFTETMAKLGVTTSLSSDQAATSLARFANIIDNEAGPQFDRLGSTVVDLGNNLATTEAELLDFGLRIAGAGKQVGLSESQILAFGGALSSVGISAEAGGTAISRVFVDIAKAVASGGEELDQFAAVAGQSTADFRRAFQEDAAGATVAFVEGLGRISEEGGNTFQVLEDLGQGNIRVRDALLRAAGAGDLLREALDLGSEAWQENTALTTEAELRFRTTRSQLTLLWNRFRDIGITLGNALLPLLQSLVGALDGVVPMIERLAESFVRLPVPVQAVAVGLAAAAAAAGPLLLVFGQLAFAASSLGTAFGTAGIATKGIGLALAALSNPITATIALLVGAGGLVAALVTARGAIDNFNQSSLDDRRTAQLERQRQVLASMVEVIKQMVRDGREIPPALLREAAARQESIRILERQIAETEESSDAWIANAHAMTVVRQEHSLLPPAIGETAEAINVLSLRTHDLTTAMSEALVPLGLVPITLERVGFATQGATASFQGLIGVLPSLGQNIDLVGEGLSNSLGPSTWDRIVRVASSGLADLNNVFIRAFEGGGGIAGAIQSLATTLTRGFLSMIPVVGEFLSQFSGAIVAGFKRLGGFFRRLFGGPSEAELAGREQANAFIDAFIAEADVSADRIADAVAQGWDARLAEFALAAQDMFVAAGRSAEEAMPLVQQLFDAIQQGPEAVQEVIAQFEAMGIEVDNLQVGIDGLTASTETDFDAMQQAADRYGISLHALGPAFKQAQIGEEATSLLEDFNLLTAGGANVERVLRGMGDEVNEFLARAERTGARVPASMRPMLQQMIDLGLLTDASGNKIEDISEIRFTETQNEVDSTTETVEGLGTATDDVNTSLEETPWQRWAREGVAAATAVGAAFRGLGDGISGLSFSSPGVVVPAEFSLPTGTRNLDFRNFGPRQFGELHGSEAVIPKGSGHLLAAEIAAALPRDGSSVNLVGDTSAVEAKLDDILRSLQFQPELISTSLRAVMAQQV